MPTISQMKTLLHSKYPTSTAWRNRVDKMADDQIIAIWYKMSQENEVQLPLFPDMK